MEASVGFRLLREKLRNRRSEGPGTHAFHVYNTACLGIRVAKGNLTLRILYFGSVTLSRMINTKHMLGLSESPVPMVPPPGPLPRIRKSLQVMRC